MNDKQLHLPQNDFRGLTSDENICTDDLSNKENIIHDSVSNKQLLLPIDEFSDLRFEKSVPQVELNLRELEENTNEMFNYLNSREIEELEKIYLQSAKYLEEILKTNDDSEIQKILNSIPNDLHINIALSLINQGKTELLLNHFSYFCGIPEKYHLSLLFEIMYLGPNQASILIKYFSKLSGIPANLHLFIVNKFVDEGYGFQVASNFDAFYGIPKEVHWDIIKEICEMNGGWIILQNITKFYLTPDHYFEFIQSVINRGESFAALEGIAKLYQNDPENQLKLAEKLIKAGYGQWFAIYFGITLAKTLPKKDHLAVADMLIQNGEAKILRNYIDSFNGIPQPIKKLFLLLGEFNDYMEEKKKL